MNTARTELVRRLESITPTLIDSLADMTVNQFVGEYSCNLLAALKAIRLGTVEQAQDEINRTIKKRWADLPSPLTSSAY